MVRTLVALALLLVPCAANAAWQQASSKHFLVYSDDAPDKVLAFATMLERVDKAMRVLRGVDDPPISPMSRVTVFVVRDLSAVHRLYGKGGSDVAGFYTPRASGSVAFVPAKSGGGEFGLNATQVLLHEYAHHFMYANSRDMVYPAWLVEGFAEYHATMRVASNGDVTVGAPPMYRIYGLAANRLSMKTVLTAQPHSMPAGDRDMFYARGWLLTHYLTTDDARRKQLADYLNALNAGKPPLEAADLLGGASALDAKLNAYLRVRLTAYVIPAAKIPVAAPVVRALTPGEAAVMPARIASTRGVDARTAPSIADQARALAAPFPNDAAAQDVLAEAEYDAGHYAAAQAAAERAFAADPKSIHAMMYQGLARMAVAAKAGSGDTANWEAARGWFRRANHADHDYAWPLEMYYASYVAAKVEPTKNAQDGLLYARELAPFDDGLGLTAAYVDLRRDDAKDATRILEPVAYNPHGGGTAVMAQMILGVLRDKGAKAAVTAFDRARSPDDTAKSAASAVSPRVRPVPSVRAR